MGVVMPEPSDQEMPDDRSAADEPVGTPASESSEQVASAVQHGSRAAAQARPGRPAFRWLAAAAMVAMLAVIGFGGQLLYQEHQSNVAGRQALEAAQRYIVKLTNIDADTIEGKSADILDGATGEFKDRYGKGGRQLHQVLSDNRAVARGTVVESWVKTATPSKAVILMFIDQAVRVHNSPIPTIERSRVKMVMSKVNGRWLASKVRVI
jgi:Mce-associated membrane protein